MDIVNIATYKFVEIEEPFKWQPILKEKCLDLQLKGTIILSKEGINLVLAGEKNSIDNILEFLNTPQFQNKFQNFDIKESFSDRQPFRKMVVRVEEELISMRISGINPQDERAPTVDSKKLTEWLERGYDDNGREIVMLDTRNGYEYEIGTFSGAIQLNIDSFHKFPDALSKVSIEQEKDLKNKTVITFCTGGIRCEKAVIYMRNQDFGNVYQLDGGILKYLELTNGKHWLGECFVFDDRIALDKDLNESSKDYSQDDIGGTTKTM